MAHHLAGFVVHRHDAGGVLDGDFGLQGRVAGQKLGQFRLIAVQDKIRIGHRGRANGKTGDNCRRPKIATHGVYRKHHKPAHRPFGKRAAGISALARACHGFVRPLA